MREGADRATSVHDSQPDAVICAREIAKKHEGLLLVYDEKGRLRVRSVFERRPYWFIRE